MERTCSAEAGWTGGINGSGTITTDSRTLTNVGFQSGLKYAEATGTNPEELVAAAVASSFTLALADRLAKDGHEAELIRTLAHLELVRESGGWGISSASLEVSGRVADLPETEFRRHAEAARRDCAISQLLKIEPTLSFGAG